MNILQLAVVNHVPQEDMPKALIVISAMEKIRIFFIGTAHMSWYIHGIEAKEQELFARYES